MSTDPIVAVAARPTPTAKRAFDLLVSGVVLIALAPLFALIAVLVKVDSPGPVFFVQKRVGRGGFVYNMYKFRTMTADAEAQLERLKSMNKGGDQLIRIANDPRVTRVGRLLRPFGLDELPQVLNVLKGDMSLIGPRPQSPSEVLLYDEHQRRRLEVLPGITGLWQVTSRENPSFDLWVHWDLEYIDHWSFLRDLQIVVKTPVAVLRPVFRRSAEAEAEGVQERTEDADPVPVYDD